jgi:anti-sigma B factor antagonist
VIFKELDERSRTRGEQGAGSLDRERREEPGMEAHKPFSGDGAFSVRAEQDGDALVIRASGELDLSVADKFEAELRQAIAKDASVFIDLSKVGFIDSTGMRALVVAAKLATMNEGNLRISRSLSPAVERAFEVTGLAQTLPFAN